MKISSREIRLGAITAGVLLLATTYLLGDSKIKEWKDSVEETKTLVEKMDSAKRTIAQRERWQERLEATRKQLPRYSANQEVTGEMLKTLERLARDNSLILSRREPDKEKSVGDLCEVSIQCTWEGSLDALVHFLYAVQSQGAILDVQQLSVSTVEGTPGKLKGGFSVVCAFTREGGAVKQGQQGQGQGEQKGQTNQVKA